MADALKWYQRLPETLHKGSCVHLVLQQGFNLIDRFNERFRSPRSGGSHRKLPRIRHLCFGIVRSCGSVNHDNENEATIPSVAVLVGSYRCEYGRKRKFDD
jgi:hypothetical protein